MRSKYEGLGYMTDERNDYMDSIKFVQCKQYMQCSNCNRKGHTKDKCWDLHPCSLCGLKSHCEKTCWNKEYTNTSMEKCFKMDVGQSYGSSWKNITGMIKGLFRYKCLSVKNNQNLSKCQLSRNGSCK